MRHRVQYDSLGVELHGVFELPTREGVVPLRLQLGCLLLRRFGCRLLLVLIVSTTLLRSLKLLHALHHLVPVPRRLLVLPTLLLFDLEVLLDIYSEHALVSSVADPHKQRHQPCSLARATGVSSLSSTDSWISRMFSSSYIYIKSTNALVTRRSLHLV